MVIISNQMNLMYTYFVYIYIYALQILMILNYPIIVFHCYPTNIFMGVRLFLEIKPCQTTVRCHQTWQASKFPVDN